MRFHANPRLAAEIRKQPAHRAALARAAATVRDQAERVADAAGAPWMRREGVETIVVDVTGDQVAVVNTDYGGAIQEFGSRNNPPYAPLRTGAQAAGLRLDEHPHP